MAMASTTAIGARLLEAIAGEIADACDVLDVSLAPSSPNRHAFPPRRGLLML